MDDKIRKFIKNWIIQEGILDVVTEEDIENKIDLLISMNIKPEDYLSLIGNIDLHTHSFFSDGTFSASDIVFAADFLGIKVISITDHATTLAYSDIDNLFSLCTIVPGVEITTYYQGEKIHLLGYGEGVLSDKFQIVLEEIRKKWNRRFEDILSAFNQKHNCNIRMIPQKAQTFNIDDVCLAINNNLLTEYGIDEIKRIYFNKHANDTFYIPCNENYLPNFETLICKMREEGIMPVLAHTKVDEIKYLKLNLQKLHSKGLYGIEAYHPRLSQEDTKKIIEYCKRCGLNVFGGSDFHGYKKVNKLGSCSLEKCVGIPYVAYAKSILGSKHVVYTKQRELNISELSIEEKVSLLMKPSCSYYICSDKDILHGRISKERISSITELVGITQSIYKNCTIPLLLNVNQEGGRLNTIDWDWKELFPGNLCLGRIKDFCLVENCAFLMGKELRCLGITWNLAPVLDIAKNRSNKATLGRCFGREYEEFLGYIKAFVQGLQRSGVAATAKHFPDIGLTNVDPHENCPIIDSTTELDFRPYEEAIAAGVACIMVSNAIVQPIDKSNPAFMSKKVIQNVLRKKLAFNGVIVTENINMSAISHIPVEKIALNSFLAGADLVLCEPDFSRIIPSVSSINKFLLMQKNIYEELLNAVYDGTISMERLDESVLRIIKFYNKYGIKDINEICEEKYYETVKEARECLLGCATSSVEDMFIEKKCAYDAPPSNIALVRLENHEKIKADSTFSTKFNYEEIFSELGVKVDVYLVNNENEDTSFLYKYDLIIYMTYNAHLFTKQLILLSNITNLFENVVVLGVGEVYEIESIEIEKINSYINIGSMTYMQFKYALMKLFRKV